MYGKRFQEFLTLFARRLAGRNEILPSLSCLYYTSYDPPAQFKYPGNDIKTWRYCGEYAIIASEQHTDARR